MMHKKKSLWIIPIIVALIVATMGIFAAPGVMPGGEQNQVALATGQRHQQPQAQDYFYKMSKEQVDLRNHLLKQNPTLSEGELLKQVAPEALKVLPEDFIEYLCEAKAYPYDSQKPVIYLRDEYGPFPPGWSGERMVTLDEQGNPTFGPLVEKKSGSPSSTGLASVSAERIYQGFFPYIGWHSYALIRTFGTWRWSESQVLDVYGVGQYAWSDEVNYCYIDYGPILRDSGYIPPCELFAWWTECGYCMFFPGDQEPHHYFSLLAAITVEGDGWWECHYDYWGTGPGLFRRFLDTPSAGRYQES